MTCWLFDANVLSELRRPKPNARVVAKCGHTFSQPDLIIGATALHHGLTIVSRDGSEYKMANVPVLNPWTT